MSIYLKTHPVTSGNRKIKKLVYNIEGNNFEIIDPKEIKHIEESSYFRLKGEKYGSLKTQDSYVEWLEFYDRDLKTLKFKTSKAYSDFVYKEKDLILLAKPHAKFYKNKISATAKYIYSLRINDFVRLTAKQYEELGFKGLKQGYMYEYIDGEWELLTDKKFPTVLDELKIHDIIDDVCENMLSWRSLQNEDGKFAKLCETCKKKCKQFSIIGSIQCGKYDPKPKPKTPKKVKKTRKKK